MQLNYKKIGEGKPLVMLHGVFGSLDNLYTAAKKLAERGFCVYLLDARNHGQSPRSEVFNYGAMAADLDDFLRTQQIENPVLLGHSMGGKIVMQYTMEYDNFEKLIVVDIAPKYYAIHHHRILAGLNAIDLRQLESRADATRVFSQFVPDLGEQQFLLKNLYRTDDGFDWRINLPVLTQNIEEVGSGLKNPRVVTKPTLFIRGADSNYIRDQDIPLIMEYFPNAIIETIDGANHWIHATHPDEFVDTVAAFAA